jgi:hypothetical protein
MRVPTRKKTAAERDTVSRWAGVLQKKSANTTRGTPMPQNPKAIGRYSFLMPLLKRYRVYAMLVFGIA